MTLKRVCDPTNATVAKVVFMRRVFVMRTKQASALLKALLLGKIGDPLSWAMDFVKAFKDQNAYRFL